MAPIIDLHARQILDSRGNPTLEVEIYTDECIGSAAIPSGASTGAHEAVELRDATKAYNGKSVTKALNNVNNTIHDALVGFDVTKQEELDKRLCSLDGTKNKKKLGANAILGVSLAASRAGSATYQMPLYAYVAKLSKKPLDTFTLPMPFANVLNGGVHAGNDLQIQEFMIVPTGAKTFSQATQMVAEVYHALKQVIIQKHSKNAANVGDEGGFAPPLKTAEEALDLLTLAVKQAGYEGKISFALDAAASEFYTKEKNTYALTLKKEMTGKDLCTYWLSLLKQYPLISLEDPFAEDDFASWKQLTHMIAQTPASAFAAKKRPQIVGDDLTVSNPERIRYAIKEKLCTALLLKVNQIGTLSEALDAATLAHDAGWTVMVSHRSGETEDPYIADLAVGIGSGQIKLGAPCRSDRTAKYNQLLRIEEETDDIGHFN